MKQIQIDLTDFQRDLLVNVTSRRVKAVSDEVEAFKMVSNAHGQTLPDSNNLDVKLEGNKLVITDLNPQPVQESV